MQKPGSVVTIVAPPANGKTCLAASWMKFAANGQGENILWYHASAVDEDIANFFQLIGDASSHWRPAPSELPTYRAEAFLNFDGFTTAWLKAFFKSKHRGPISFIIDDVHRLGHESSLIAVLAKMIKFLGSQDHLILLSRANIPPSILDAARRRRRLIEITDLKITESEFPDFEASTINTSPLTLSDFQAALRYSGSYIAGFPFLGTIGLSEETLREKLLTLIAELNSSERLALMATAYMQVGLEQEWISLGGKLALKILKKVESKSGLVTHLQNQSLRKHDVFFETLRDWAEANASAEALKKAKVTAGRLLLRRDDVLSGVRLLVEAEAFEETKNAVVKHATRLIDLAKNKELLDIIASLPVHEQTQPEMRLWAAYARLPYTPEKAAEELAAIRSKYSNQLSVSDRALAINGEIYSALSTMVIDERMPPLIKAATDLIVELTAVKEPERSRLFIGRQVAILLGAPTYHGHGALRREAEAELLDLNPESKLILGAALVTHLLWWDGDVAKARGYHQEIADQAQNPDAAHLPVMSWHFGALGLAFRDGDPKAFTKALKAVEGFAAHRGLNSRLAPAYWMATQAYAAFGDDKAAMQSLDQHLTLVQEMRALHEHEGYYLRSAIALSQGDFDAAASQARCGYDIADRHKALQGKRQNAVVLAMSLAFKGDGAAETTILEITEVGYETENRVFLLHAAIAGAALAHARQQWDIFAKEWIKALDLSQSTGIRAITGFNADAIGRLAACALARVIEPEATARLIASWRLLPPLDEPMNRSWPYRVDVRCFGTDNAQVTVFDDGLRKSAKTNAKTEELLSLLIAGGSAGIPQHALIRELWPDQQGIDAGNNLRQQIKKLRDLTTYEGVRLTDGQYSLNRQLIMSDVQCLEEAILRLSDNQLEIFERVAALDDALDVYKGPLLRKSQLPLITMHRERIAAALRAEGLAFLEILMTSDPEGAASRRKLLTQRLL